jgi:hypothetical protein
VTGLNLWEYCSWKSQGQKQINKEIEMTEVIATTIETLDVKSNIGFTEVTRRKSSKDGSEFLTGTFNQFNRPVNGEPQDMYNRFICSDSETMTLIESALQSGDRVNIVYKMTPNNYVKKDKAGNTVMVDGKELMIYQKQYQIKGIAK